METRNCFHLLSWIFVFFIISPLSQIHAQTPSDDRWDCNGIYVGKTLLREGEIQIFLKGIDPEGLATYSKKKSKNKGGDRIVVYFETDLDSKANAAEYALYLYRDMGVLCTGQESGLYDQEILTEPVHWENSSSDWLPVITFPAETISAHILKTWNFYLPYSRSEDTKHSKDSKTEQEKEDELKEP